MVQQTTDHCQEFIFWLRIIGEEDRRWTHQGSPLQTLNVWSPNHRPCKCVLWQSRFHQEYKYPGFYSIEETQHCELPHRIFCISKEDTETNLSDVLTKVLSKVRKDNLICYIFYPHSVHIVNPTTTENSSECYLDMVREVLPAATKMAGSTLAGDRFFLMDGLIIGLNIWIRWLHSLFFELGEQVRGDCLNVHVGHGLCTCWV